jgi:hypothetical protein
VAYCPPELLDDLGDVFANLRTWTGVIEKRPGVFYVRNQPFLHFHLLAGGRRRADVKGYTHWVQLDLPRPVTAARRRALFRELRMRYGEKVETKSRVRRRSPNHTPQRTGARDARPGR